MYINKYIISSMSIKQAAVVAVGLVGGALLFSWVYLSLDPSGMADKPGMQEKKSVGVAKDEPSPATVSGVVDEVLRESESESAVLDEALADELRDLEEGNAAVNQLESVYEETDAQ
jgi:hypothetical protein